MVCTLLVKMSSLLYHVPDYCFSCQHLMRADSEVGPGARKPSVGEEIESRRPLVCSAFHSFIFLFSVFAPILVC